MDRDDEEDESGESDGEEDEEQEREESQYGIRGTQSLHSTEERRPDIGTMVNALQQEGETHCAFSCTSLLFKWELEDGKTFLKIVMGFC